MVLRNLASRRHLLTVAGCTAALMASGMGWVGAQQPPQAPAGQAPQGRGGGGGGRGNAGPAIFTVADANKDGAVTRDEMKATFDTWFTQWDSAKTGSLTQEQLLAGLTAALPAPAPPGRRRWRVLPGSRPCRTATDAKSRARAGHDGRAPGHGPCQAETAAQGTRPRQGGRVRALVDPHRRPDHRGARQENRGVDYHDHLRPGRHQRGEPQAVRRHLPGEHDRRVSRRSEGRGGDGSAEAGPPRLRAWRQRSRGHPRRHRFLSPEPALG